MLVSARWRAIFLKRSYSDKQGWGGATDSETIKRRQANCQKTLPRTFSKNDTGNDLRVDCVKRFLMKEREREKIDVGTP